MRGKGETSLRIGFLVGDVDDAATIRRAFSLSRTGSAVTLFGFSRDRYTRDADRDWDVVRLGAIRDRRYLSRAFRLALALLRIISKRTQFRSCDRLYARNIDMALLTMVGRFLLGSKAPLTYEILDIAGILTREDMLGKLLRLVERFVLHKSDELVVTSAGYIDGYFAPKQGFGGRWLELENKLVALQTAGVSRPDLSERRKSGSDPRWRLGWFGTLRSEDSLRVLTKAASVLDGRLRVGMHGIFTRVSKEAALDIIGRCPYIEYRGPYSWETDLRELYQNIDLMWCGDIGTIDGLNDTVLLPNRLYESAYFGVPLIGVAGSKLAKRIDEGGLGWVLTEGSAECVARFFEKLTMEEYNERVKHILSRNEEEFVETNEWETLVDNWKRENVNL